MLMFASFEFDVSLTQDVDPFISKRVQHRCTVTRRSHRPRQILPRFAASDDQDVVAV
jgi:hypothetical protein